MGATYGILGTFTVDSYWQAWTIHIVLSANGLTSRHGGPTGDDTTQGGGGEVLQLPHPLYKPSTITVHHHNAVMEGKKVLGDRDTDR